MKPVNFFENRKLWSLIRILSWLIILIWTILIYFNIQIIRTSFLELFWILIIPIIVLIIYLSPSLWRNACPLASTNLFYFNFFHIKKLKKLGIKANILMIKKRKLNKAWQFLRTKGTIISGILFWTIIPLRLTLFNNNSFLTVLLLTTIFSTAFIMGFLFPVKSGWCTSICPIFSVEKTYSINLGKHIRNTRCDFQDKQKKMTKNCSNCSVNCIDLTNPEEAYWKDESMNVFHNMKNSMIRKIFISSFPGLIISYIILYFNPLKQQNLIIKIIMNYGIFLFFMFLTTIIYFSFKNFFKNKALKKHKKLEFNKPNKDYAKRKNQLNLIYVNFSFLTFFIFSTYNITHSLLPKLLKISNNFNNLVFVIIIFFVFYNVLKNLNQGWNESWIKKNYKTNWF